MRSDKLIQRKIILTPAHVRAKLGIIRIQWRFVQHEVFYKIWVYRCDVRSYQTSHGVPDDSYRLFNAQFLKCSDNRTRVFLYCVLIPLGFGRISKTQQVRNNNPSAASFEQLAKYSPGFTVGPYTMQQHNRLVLAYISHV